MPISNGALVSIFSTLETECVVTLEMDMEMDSHGGHSDDDLQRDEQFFVRQCGATESIIPQTLGHQPYLCQSLLFVSDVPKPSFVLVRPR